MYYYYSCAFSVVNALFSYTCVRMCDFILLCDKRRIFTLSSKWATSDLICTKDRFCTNSVIVQTNTILMGSLFPSGGQWTRNWWTFRKEVTKGHVCKSAAASASLKPYWLWSEPPPLLLREMTGRLVNSRLAAVLVMFTLRVLISFVLCPKKTRQWVKSRK